MRLTRPRLWGPRAGAGLALLGAVLAADQALKTWLLWGFDIAARQPVALTPFLDIVLVWNLGVSYGLFEQTSATGQALLAAFKILAAAALWVWLAATPSATTALSLAAIAGGALGNAVDRILYGGVADFFSLHLRAIGSSFHWYVFNLADVAIVAGVAVLLYESVSVRPAPALNPPPPGQGEERRGAVTGAAGSDAGKGSGA